jgi:hypothetical protein
MVNFCFNSFCGSINTESIAPNRPDVLLKTTKDSFAPVVKETDAENTIQSSPEKKAKTAYESIAAKTTESTYNEQAMKAIEPGVISSIMVNGVQGYQVSNDGKTVGFIELANKTNQQVRLVNGGNTSITYTMGPLGTRKQAFKGTKTIICQQSSNNTIFTPVACDVVVYPIQAHVKSASGQNFFADLQLDK